MTLTEATDTAEKLATEYETTLHVVRDDSYDEPPAHQYYIADDNDLLDHFFSCPVVYTTGG